MFSSVKIKWCGQASPLTNLLVSLALARANTVSLVEIWQIW